MANYIVQDTSLETVADAIRAKAGISEKLVFPDGWKAAVDGIQSGGVEGVTFSARGVGIIPDIPRRTVASTFAWNLESSAIGSVQEV
jgi:hypothetical protein